jgi:methylated-DNA-[protein]-cysteine S-methyltransferase
MSKENTFIYNYKCPEDLGYLEITLDTKGRVFSCIFTDIIKVKSKNNLPINISKALDNYFNNKKDLPLNLISKDIRGTDFQKSIWSLICDVKFGETITYTDMAIKANKPLAIRAAGSACGKNPVALFIPCHRVIRKQSEDYGYSWGVERKKWLLNFEAK